MNQAGVTVLAAWALMLNALVWGVSWWPFRLLEAQGLHPLWATFFIYALAMACLLLVRRQALRALFSHPGLWVLALVGGLTNVGFNWAVTIGDVVRVVLLFYLMPAWVVLLAWPLLGEVPTRASLLRLALALTGVVVVLKSPQSPWPLPASLADWLALMGGLSFALTNILLRKLRNTPDEGRVAALFSGGGLVPLCAALALMHWGSGQVSAPPAASVGWIAITLGTGLAFLIGNFGLQYGAARLTASATSLIMLTELVFASGSSVAMGAAELTVRTWLGGSLILAAALWSAWPQRAGPTPHQA